LARPPKILFTILLLIFAFGSCGASASMEISRQEAAANLKQGDIDFILSMDPSKMQELAKLDPSAPFYAGLLVESAGDTVRAGRLFEAALSSPIPKIKSEAARKLISFLTESRDFEQAGRILRFINEKNTMEEFVTLKGAALYVLNRFGELISHYEENSPLREKSNRNGRPALSLMPEKAAEEFESWNRAFCLLSAVKLQKPGTIAIQELRPFLLESPANAAYRWTYDELQRSRDHIFPAAERAAAAGRLAVSGRAYAEALRSFDTVRNVQSSLFFRYDFLLSDLGRAYTSTASKREAGFKLFTDWESAMRTGRNSPVSLSDLTETEQKTIRHILLFYAGRIRRQQGKHGEAGELFARALALAPDAVQEDACIWYILNGAMTEKPETVPGLIKTYAGRWHRDDDFYDILDKLSCYLVGQKKWNDLADVFFAIRNGKDGSIIARYAYLAGRAVSLGYIQGRNMSARDYFTVAYREGNASFYYRALAASHLGRTVVPVSSQSQNTGTIRFPHELEFYVKFFEFGASSYAMAYVRENAARYSIRELRIVAGTFAASDRYLESIQIAGIFMRRDNYVMERADLKLYYPNPYSDLIERYARSNGIHPSVFFGLIRTESAFTPAIASHAGAVGLAQIMPATAKEVAAVIKKRGGPDYAAGSEIDLTNPEINIHMGAVYLKDLTDSMGSPMLALLGYNGGPARIRRLRREAPSLPEDLFIETIAIAETRNYGKRVMAAAAAYGYLYYNMSMNEVVTSIFK